MYSCIISDILVKFCMVEAVVMGDVTYGACCIDDYTAASLGCDFIIHYGHSCLVPINVTKVRVLYVFVSISFDLSHLAGLISSNFDSKQSIGLLGTVQFAAMLPEVAALLPNFRFVVPQAKPLSPGEVLGCTAPKMDVDCYL
jgi:2-(3-amino-3-carboxypropyl)histidine synthase